MCRLAAFPPRFSRVEALEILANFENQNVDGTGSAYVKDGEFIVEKWAKPFSKVVRRNRFLSHMPNHDGWTIVHLRAASHGCNKVENTHPFIVGDWAFIHNGVWSDYELVKLAISNQVKIVGETDTEVAANFWNIVGPKTFAKAVKFGGVFMGLHRNGKLWVANTSGDLEIKALSGQRIVLASEFNRQNYENTVDAMRGWYEFDKNGRYLRHKENDSTWTGGYPYRGSSSVTCGSSRNSGNVESYGQHMSCYNGYGD